MRRAILIAASLILWVVAVADGAGANPIVSLANAAQFAAALVPPPPPAVPVLQPVVAPNSTQNKAFPGSTTQSTALYTNTSQINGLVSATGSAANLNSKTPINGGYTYTPRIDPDFSGYFLNMKLLLPQVGAFGDPGIDALGIALTDRNGNAKIWEFNNTVLLAGVPENFFFKFDQNAGAGGSTSFFMDPGFDNTHVVNKQVADEGTLTASFPSEPPSEPPSPFPAPPGPTLWFGTEKFAVLTPEPGSLGLLAAGLLVPGAVLLRRRRKG